MRIAKNIAKLIVDEIIQYGQSTLSSNTNAHQTANSMLTLAAGFIARVVYINASQRSRVSDLASKLCSIEANENIHKARCFIQQSINQRSKDTNIIK